MTVSDRYARLAPSTIIVPASRQRSDLDLDEGFLHSLRERGVISPLLVTQDNVLVAGGRRLAGAIALGLADVPVRFCSEGISEELVRLIELEENVRRRELSWQDMAHAVRDLHEFYKRGDSEWTQARTSAVLGPDMSTLAQYLRVARALDDPDECEKIKNAPHLFAARNILDRVDQRRQDAVMEEISHVGAEMFNEYAGQSGEEAESSPVGDDGALGSDASVPAASASSEGGQRASAGVPVSHVRGVAYSVSSSPPSDILCADFIEWASTYSGPRFNFLHCDFPYGKRVFGGEWGGKNSEEEFQYDDDPEIYWKLCAALCEHLDRVMTPTAHLMFWTSSEVANLHATIEFFRARRPELIFQKRALTWHKSDNAGIVSEPLHGPRWICETALMATRGDRVLVKPKASSYSAPTARSLHPSTKPEPVLRHFFEMFVDSTTRMLDPTCGAGSALRAAESLGAGGVLGIEKSAEYVESARKALRAFRNLAELAQ